MAQTHSLRQTGIPADGRARVTEVRAFLPTRPRRHSEPFLGQAPVGRHLDESGLFRAGGNDALSYDQRHLPAVLNIAYGDDGLAPTVSSYSASQHSRSSTGSNGTSISSASLPGPQLEKGRSNSSTKGQRQPDTTVIDPDYDYWADVADLW